MAQLRVSIEDLSSELAAAVAAARAGEEVLLEDQGDVVARVIRTQGRTDWRAFLHELDALPPVDPAFGNTVLETM